MIDEKVLIERLEEELKLADGEKEKCARGNPLMFDNAKGYSTGISTAISIVKDLAEEHSHCALCYLGSPCEYQNKDAILPVELLADNNGWISVKDALPEEDGRYIVTVKNLTGYWIMESNVFVCDYELGDFIFQGWEDNKVIAWQPLPAPYKKGE